MITSINSNNSLDYRGLFEEATQDLIVYAKELLVNIGVANNQETLLLFINRFPGGKDYDKENIATLTNEVIENVVKISTLNDYFCNIVELSGINPQYVVLPINEDKFEIDANSRVITVPASFKKNGIGVQGDHTAETIHFVIDRYFDSIDLAADDIFIAIEYEGPKGGTKIDPAVFKDVATLQNKIIFGWIIDKDVTKVPGNIKFAVHFFKGKVDAETNKITEVSYSFNTLMAQVVINKAFEFDLSSFDTQRDPSQLVIDRLTNSKADGAVEALMPIFVINLPTENVDLKDADGVDEDVTAYTFNALAHSPDAGYITYTWYKVDKETDKEIPSYEEYIKTEDLAPQENKIYYYYNESDEKWIRLNSNDTFEEGRDYFEYRSFCVVNEVGTYYVAVDNHVGTDVERAISNKVTVPRPTMPKAETILVADYNAELRYGYDEEVNYIRATKELGTTETLYISATANENEGLGYCWYKIENADEHLKVIPDLNDEVAGYERVAVTEIIEKGEYTTEETGWYTVDLVGTRNGATVYFPSEKYYRLTSAPSVPLFIERENAEDTSNMLEEDVYLPLNETAKVELQDSSYIYSDEIILKWYKDVKPYPYDDNAEEEEKYDELIVAFTGMTEIPTSELYNHVGDVIYCKPTNIYNKAEITGPASRRFFILDSKASESADEELTIE